MTDERVARLETAHTQMQREMDRLRRERDEALRDAAEERAKHALTLAHYEAQPPAPAAPGPGLRDAVIEECAKVALAQRVEGDGRPSWNAACASAYAAIRALKVQP